MLSVADIGERRLREVLVKDKSENPNKISDILRGDILDVLKNYMDVTKINVHFDVDTSGYTLTISAEANRIKNFGILPD